jgi:hypothetical protein
LMVFLSLIIFLILWIWVFFMALSLQVSWISLQLFPALANPWTKWCDASGGQQQAEPDQLDPISCGGPTEVRLAPNRESFKKYFFISMVNAVPHIHTV